jgi:hypothetical protein
VLGLFVDLVDLDVGEPERPPCAALDDAAVDAAAESERQIGTAPQLDQLRAPRQHTLVEGTRRRPIGRVQLQMDNRSRSDEIHDLA